MEDFQVATIESVVSEIDIFISSSGNFNIITSEHMKSMKNNAIVDEIDMAMLEGIEDTKVDNIEPQVDISVPRWLRCDRVGFCASPHSGLHHRPPLLHDVVLFANQVHAQLELLKNQRKTRTYEQDVYLLPIELDEKVAELEMKMM